MSKVHAISLFSGAGGLDLGSLMAGVPVSLSTDIDSDSIKTLEKNIEFKNTKIIEGDLHEMGSEIFNKIVEDGKLKNKKAILIGGAPCQPFSKASYWVGNENRKGINDPRALLIDEYLRVLQGADFSGFVFENVESILHPSHKKIAEEFVEITEELGYDTKIIRATSLDYGVAQNRRRVFIMGTKGKFKRDEPIKTHCAKEDVEEKGLKEYINAGEAIEGYNTDEYFEEYEVTKGGTYYEELCEIPPGKNYKHLTEWAGHPNPKFEADKRFWSFLLKLSPERYSWTITAQPGTWVGPFHWDNRRLRVPEIAALQAFPKNYKFYGSRRSIQRQIGNAVPSLMGKAMIYHVKESLLDV